jgi:anti-sigma B factor antagonist
VVTVPSQRSTFSSSDLLSVSTTWPQAGLAVLRARGEVDLQTRAELVKEVDEVMSPPFPRQLVVDLDEVGFIGAAGLEVMLELSEKCRAHATELSLVSTSRAVLRAIEVAGLGRMLEVGGYPS